MLPRRKLGKTEYDVCPLGFGASPLGSIYSVCVDLGELQVLVYIHRRGYAVQEVSEDVAVKTVHEAFHQGINYFDTSPFYGDGLSETVCVKLTQLSLDKLNECMPFCPMQMLGKGLKDLPRDQIVLATKFGRYGPNLFDFSAERVRGVHQSPHVTHQILHTFRKYTVLCTMGASSQGTEVYTLSTTKSAIKYERGARHALQRD